MFRIRIQRNDVGHLDAAAVCDSLRDYEVGSLASGADDSLVLQTQAHLRQCIDCASLAVVDRHVDRVETEFFVMILPSVVAVDNIRRIDQAVSDFADRFVATFGKVRIFIAYAVGKVAEPREATGDPAFALTNFRV